MVDDAAPPAAAAYATAVGDLAGRCDPTLLLAATDRR